MSVRQQPRGRGRPRQYLELSDPKWKVSDLTLEQFTSRERASKPRQTNDSVNSKNVFVNYFPIVKFPTRGFIYQYHFEIEDQKRTHLSRVYRRALYNCWLNKYCQHNQDVKKFQIVFDNDKIIFTINQALPNINETKTIETVSMMNKSNRQEDYTISIKRVGNEIDLNLLNSFSEFYDMENNYNVNHEDIQQIKQSLSIALHEHCSSNADFIYNRVFFTYPISRKDHGYWDLGLGKASWRGFYSCLVFANGTHQLLMNLDVSHGIFMKAQSFCDFLCEVVRHSPLGKKYDGDRSRSNQLDINVVVKFLNPTTIKQNDYFREIEFLLNHCKNLSVRSHVANKTIGYKIIGIADAASRQTFPWKKDKKCNIENEITIEKYYKENYGIDLNYPTLPTVKMTNGSFVPMEFLEIQPVKVKKVTDEQRALLCLKSSMNPYDYYRSIGCIRQNPKQQCFETDPFIKAWDLDVDGNMLQVKARVLQTPKVIYGGNFHVGRQHHRPAGVWTNTRSTFFRPNPFPRVWALINLSSSMNDESCEIFSNELNKVARDRGIDCPLPVIYYEYQAQANSITTTINELKNMMEKSNDCKFFIIILPEDKNTGDQLYGDLKKLCELQSGLGIVTQMIKLKNKEFYNQWSYSRLHYVLHKINVKLDGINSILDVPDNIKEFFSRGHRYMYVGVDLSHSVSNSGIKYSTVAVVASADEIPNRYFKEVYVQERSLEARKQSLEYVVDMKNIMKSLIHQYEQHRGYPPKAIVIYRDGISNSEFDTVFEDELTAIREACVELSKVYRPYLTYIVVNKRHHTRFFPTDSTGYVEAGTVIDSNDIINPTTYNFFLNSHHSDKGTSRPTHYHVLYDDNKLEPCRVQLLTYALCYANARCTRSISIPAPVKYADLLAFRANFYINKNDPLNRESSCSETSNRIDQNVNVNINMKSRRIELNTKLPVDCSFFL